MADLKVFTCGQNYNSPIVVSASPLTDSVDLIKRAEECGAGAVSTKLTLLYQPVKGIRQMYREPGLFNFNPSDKRNDLEDGLRLVRGAKEKTNLVVWANIAGPGGDLDGWIKIAKEFEQAGADCLELNMICPNISMAANAMGEKVSQTQMVGGAVGKDPELASAVVNAVKPNVNIPVWCKLTSEVADMTVIAKRCAEAGTDGLVVNAAPLAAPSLDIYQKGKPRMATLKNCSFGGITGPTVRHLSYRYIAQISKAVDIPVAGGGGVNNWQHAVEAIMYGSTLVTMCTEILWNGFDVISKINQKLLEFMDKQGYSSLEDFRGIALPYFVPSSQLENELSYAVVVEEKCNGCKICSKIGCCSAIEMVNKKAVINKDVCIGCGLCWASCNRDAIAFVPLNQTG